MATVQGINAASSIMPFTVATGSETRPPTPGVVMWIGGTTEPIHMQDGDIWFREQATGPSAPEFVTTTLNTLTQSVAFSQPLLLNGTTPFTFTITAGSLPVGLTIHSVTGVISGTPSASGAYSFTVQASNAVGSASRAFSGTVTSSVLAPNITTTSLNSLTQGTAFSQTLNASGTGPLTWTVDGGTIPSGLTLNSSTGAITGTPTGSGAYSFSVQVSNTGGNDSQTYSGTIATSGTAPTITTTTLNTITEGVFFSQTLNKTGSTPMTWGVSAGGLPTGLTINSSTGVISGTPTADGAYSFTIQATNSFGSDTQAYSGTVAAGAGDDIYSIWNDSSTSLTPFSDAGAGDWLSHQFYQKVGDPALPAGTKIIGARCYVPSGSAHIGLFWYAALLRTTGGLYPGFGSLPHTQFDSNGTKKFGGTLVAGWNEVLFDAEWDIVPAGGGWMIALQIGDGSKYHHNAAYSALAIQNPEGKNFWLAEAGSGSVNRCFYNNTAVTSARWYGIDCLLRIPS